MPLCYPASPQPTIQNVLLIHPLDPESLVIQWMHPEWKTQISLDQPHLPVYMTQDGALKDFNLEVNLSNLIG